MTTIYLIRHAEAEGNLYRIAQGQHDSNLTGWGWRQVQALERRFQGVHIDAVYSSDLYRACATASAIYKPRGLPLHRRPGLREICVGDWEHRTWGDIARRYPQEMKDFSQRMDRWFIPGAETPAQVQRRVAAEIRAIAAENPDRTVAAVSHGYAIRLVLAGLQGVSLRDTGSKVPTGDNTSVSLIEEKRGDLRLVWQNDNRHLLAPEFTAGGCRPRKRANALEPGLWFQPLAEGAALPEALAASGALSRPGLRSLAGFLGETPAGLLQMGPEPNRIAWLWVREEYRRRGYGIQLLGQAVVHARESGGGLLLVLPTEEGGAFFRGCGFVPCAAAPELMKDISFHPEFLERA